MSQLICLLRRVLYDKHRNVVEWFGLADMLFKGRFNLLDFVRGRPIILQKQVIQTLCRKKISCNISIHCSQGPLAPKKALRTYAGLYFANNAYEENY